jgi:hypothetical protein
LEAKVLTGDDLLEKDVDTCGASDLMGDILAGLSEGSILLTGLTAVRVMRAAVVAGDNGLDREAENGYCGDLFLHEGY